MTQLSNKNVKKTSWVAFTSIIFVALGLLVLALESIMFGRDIPILSKQYGPYRLSEIIVLVLFGLAFVLGLISLCLIYSTKKPLKGTLYAVISIAFGAPIAAAMLIGPPMVAGIEEVRSENNMAITANESMVQLGKAIIAYAQNHDGHLPDANRWCDLIMEYKKDLKKDSFKHPLLENWECNFAYNKNLSGLKLSEIPNDVVLLFEANGGWNLNGDAELVKKVHGQREWFIGVLFIDGAFGKYSFDQERVDGFHLDKPFHRPLRWEQ